MSKLYGFLGCVVLMLVMVVPSCVEEQQGGGGGDGGDASSDAGKVDAGCQISSDCSKGETLSQICSAGSCYLLPQTKSRINNLKLSFSTTATELYGKISSFTYFAIHPWMVNGDTALCSGLLSVDVNPLSGVYNVIQKNTTNGLSNVFGDLQTSTLDFPDTTGLLMFIQVRNANNELIGLGCQGNINMPVTPSSKVIGIFICPTNKLAYCISSGG